jgi:hypothetical protein
MKAEFQKGDLIRINTTNKHYGSRRGIIYSFDIAKKKARVAWSTGNKTIEWLDKLKRVASCES